MIDVPVPAWHQLPPALTTPIPAPPPPPKHCRDRHGRPAACALDGLLTIPAWRAALGTCNADRARAAAYGATDPGASHR